MTFKRTPTDMHNLNNCNILKFQKFPNQKHSNITIKYLNDVNIYSQNICIIEGFFSFIITSSNGISTQTGLLLQYG